MSKSYDFSVGLILMVGFAVALFAQAAQASPVLQCEVTYAGASSQVETRIVHDLDAKRSVEPDIDTGGAYTKESVDIGGRFRFKAVMLAHGTQLHTVKIYAYYVLHSRAILLQEVKYSAPFKFSAEPYSLTGHNFLYAPPLDRELQYGCALTEDKS